MLIAQLSDPHIKLPGRLAYRQVDTATLLGKAVAHLNQLDPAPDLVVITGDLTDVGSPQEYAHLRQLLSPLKAPLIVVPGNHDEREALRNAVPRLALDAPLPGGGVLRDIAMPVLDIASAGLSARNRLNSSGDNETGYLAPLQEIARSGVVSAQRLLDLYNGPWGGDLTRVYEEHF